uniref:BTB domain-containing protein n=1 Tax=Strongyloides venezuelensis TaxID=75913 RepID=A0A0K0FP61_STRVS
MEGIKKNVEQLELPTETHKILDKRRGRKKKKRRFSVAFNESKDTPSEVHQKPIIPEDTLIRRNRKLYCPEIKKLFDTFNCESYVYRINRYYACPHFVDHTFQFGLMKTFNSDYVDYTDVGASAVLNKIFRTDIQSSNNLQVFSTETISTFDLEKTLMLSNYEPFEDLLHLFYNMDIGVANESMKVYEERKKESEAYKRFHNQEMVRRRNGKPVVDSSNSDISERCFVLTFTFKLFEDKGNVEGFKDYNEDEARDLLHILDGLLGMYNKEAVIKAIGVSNYVYEEAQQFFRNIAQGSLSDGDDDDDYDGVTNSGEEVDVFNGDKDTVSEDFSFVKNVSLNNVEDEPGGRRESIVLNGDKDAVNEDFSLEQSVNLNDGEHDLKKRRESDELNGDNTIVNRDFTVEENVILTCVEDVPKDREGSNELYENSDTLSEGSTVKYNSTLTGIEYQHKNREGSNELYENSDTVSEGSTTTYNVTLTCVEDELENREESSELNEDTVSEGFAVKSNVTLTCVGDELKNREESSGDTDIVSEGSTMEHNVSLIAVDQEPRKKRKTSESEVGNILNSTSSVKIEKENIKKRLSDECENINISGSPSSIQIGKEKIDSEESNSEGDNTINHKTIIVLETDQILKDYKLRKILLNTNPNELLKTWEPFPDGAFLEVKKDQNTIYKFKLDLKNRAITSFLKRIQYKAKNANNMTFEIRRVLLKKEFVSIEGTPYEGKCKRLKKNGKTRYSSTLKKEVKDC